MFRYENKRLTIYLHNLILIDTLWPLNEVDLTSNQMFGQPLLFFKTAGGATMRLAARRSEHWNGLAKYLERNTDEARPYVLGAGVLARLGETERASDG